MSETLQDIRPPEGEYFYVDQGVVSYTSNSFQHYRCFVCDTITNEYANCRFVNAIAQCRESGKRILGMFKHVCPCPENHHNGGVTIVIPACLRHQCNAQVLCDLTADGIITPARVQSAMKAGLTAAEFHELVALKARSIWEQRERDRSFLNWRDAWTQFIQEKGHIPSRAQREERARRIWEENKQRCAELDWREAEKEILKHYSLAVK